MASDFAIAQPRVRSETWIVEAAFVVFLLLVFVGLTPFAPRMPAILRLGASGTTGSGDIMRQISFLGAFSVLAFGAFRKFGTEAIGLIPLTLGLLLIWCVASSLWAAEPAVTFRRAGLEVVIVLSAIWGIETLGIERSLKILRVILAGVLIVNWISIPLLHNAIHQPGELDPALVGAWRGLYYHKNIAGSVTAISAMVFLFFAVDQKSRVDWLLFFAAAVFVVMTKSKSSIGLLIPALLAGAVYKAAWKNSLDRSIAAVVALIAGVLVLAFALVDWDDIARFISDPQEFTGRTAIWQAEFAFIADHPIFGAGFGSFTDTGAVSPLHNYVSGDWIEAIAHGHNGYIQLIVEIGIVGFVLAILALVVQPALAFWRHDGIPVPFKAFLFSLFAFMAFHNFMESDFLQGDGAVWVSLLMLIAMLRQARAISERGTRSGL
jgi:exopolysaccharide production protein ExoQ